MRVLKPSRIKEYIKKHSAAKTSLEAWLAIAEDANWENLIEVRKQLPSADAVEVKSKHTVTVFNISGNNYRLIVAIKYEYKMVYVLRFLTHAEYDKEKWKGEL
jgi:mRNA interferase HigB